MVLQGPLRLLEDFTWFHQDLYKIFSQEVVKDLDHALHARTPKTISQDRQQKIKGLAAGEDLTRSRYKNFSQKSFHTSTSNTWHHQDLDARTS